MNKRTLAILFGIDMTTVFFILTLCTWFKIENVNAQTVGDYRCKDNTNFSWTTTNKWEQWNGSTWVSADYPGIDNTANTVTIQNGNTVRLNVSPAYSIKNLILDNNSSLVIGTASVPQTTLTVTENITINTGTTLAARASTGGTHTLYVGGNIIDNGTLDFAAGSVVKAIFNGAANQSINGSGTIAFDTLILDKSGTNLSIDVMGNVPINHNLNFSSDGLLIVNSNANIKMADVATITGYNSNRYIELDGDGNNGKSSLIKVSRSNLIDWAFPFAIGTATGGYSPMIIDNINYIPNGSSTLTVKPIVNDNAAGRLKRLFRLTVNGNSNSTYLNDVTFGYADPTDIFSGDTESNYTTVWKNQSGVWSDVKSYSGAITTSVDFNANTFSIHTYGTAVAAPLFTGTYYYTIGTSISPMPLPVSLVYFVGNAVDNGVELKWETSSEINNDYFTIEKSATGENFLPMTTITGHGTTHETHDYRWVDSKPTSSKTYYRLRQVDYDGVFTHSKIIAVDGMTMPIPMNLSVYPNPIKGNEFSIELIGIKNTNQVLLEIYDLFGRKLYSMVLPVDKSLKTTHANISTENLPNGIYLIKAVGIVKKVIIDR